MERIVDVLAWNALDASILAMLIAGMVRLFRPRSPLRHALWLLVLFKLVAPPVARHSLGFSAGSLRGIESMTRVAANVQRSLPSPDESTADRYALDPQPPLALLHPLDESHSPLPALGELFSPSSPFDSTANDLAFSRPNEDSMAVATNAFQPVIRTGSRRVIRVQVPDPRVLLWGTLAAGSLAILVYRIRQWRALRRLLAKATEADQWIRDECTELAISGGLIRPPVVKITAESVAPNLTVLGKPIILLPRQLVDHGGREVCRCVLAHELAHLRRRDHWTCRLELAVSLLYWWLPTYWWAVRRLRQAADEASDSWSVWILGNRRRYAESLLKTVEFILADRVAAPSWGPALGARDTLARRLTMIMREPLCHRLTWRARLGVALLGLMVLPTAPRELGAQESKASTPPATTPSEAEFDAVLEELVQDRDSDPAQSRRRGDDRREREGPRAPDRPRAPEQPDRPRAPEQPDRPRAPEQPDRPRPPEQPDRPRGDHGPHHDRDPERRLSELEQKVDRILQLLQSPQRGFGATAPSPPGMHMPPMNRGFGGAVTQPGGFGQGQPRTPRPPGQGAESPGRPGEPQPDGHREMLSSGDFERISRDLEPEQRDSLHRALRTLQADFEKMEAEMARVMAEFQRQRAELERRRSEIIRGALEHREHREHAPGAEHPRETRPGSGRRGEPGSGGAPPDGGPPRREPGHGPDRPGREPGPRGSGPEEPGPRGAESPAGRATPTNFRLISN